MLDLEQLRAIVLPPLLPYGVQRLAVFGSVARGEETPESDVDLLIELVDPPRQPLGMLGLARLEEELGQRLGRTVELVFADALGRYVRPYVERDQVTLYESS